MDNRESALESSEYSEYGFLVPFLQKGIEVGGGGGGEEYTGQGSWECATFSASISMQYSQRYG